MSSWLNFAALMRPYIITSLCSFTVKHWQVVGKILLMVSMAMIVTSLFCSSMLRIVAWSMNPICSGSKFFCICMMNSQKYPSVRIAAYLSFCYSVWVALFEKASKNPSHKLSGTSTAAMLATHIDAAFIATLSPSARIFIKKFFIDSRSAWSMFFQISDYN